jgi:hypothetical protein
LHGDPKDTPIALSLSTQNENNDSMVAVGTSLKDCHLAIRDLFAMLGGRENLDLYQIMADNIQAGRV